MPSDNQLYFSTARQLYDLVTTDDEYVPLWGTCLGFETIASIVAEGGQESVLGNFDAEKIALPLDYTPESLDGRMYNPATVPTDVYTTLGWSNVTTNWHTFGVSVDSFKELLEPGGLVMLSTNEDKVGNTFVSSLEHATKPVYAVQWHPESNQFDGDDKAGDATPDRSPEGVEVMKYLSSFFVNEARRNDKSFDTGDDFKAVVLGANRDDWANDGWRYWFK
jgi:gamma-glutamyl hydrolase